MEKFKSQFKEKHPDISLNAAICKTEEGTWKSMSEEEKATYDMMALY